MMGWGLGFEREGMGYNIHDHPARAPLSADGGDARPLLNYHH